MLRLARFLKGYKIQLIFGPAFKLTEAVFELIVPIVMASIIDKGVNNNDTAYVYKMGGVLVLLGVTGLACALVCQYFASVASQGTGTVLRNELFRHITSLSHAELDKFGTHTLVTRMTNDINQIQLAVAMLIRLVIRAPFLVVGAVIMTVMIDTKLSLVILAVTPIIACIIYFIMNKLTPFYKLIQKKLDNITLITRENLSGARVIRAFSCQDKERERFTEAGNDLADTAVRVGKMSALLNPLTSVMMNIGIIVIIWTGGRHVDIGTLTQGQLIAFINYMTQILIAMLVVADIVLIFTKAAASASRINEVFDTIPSITNNESNVVFDKSKPAVNFSNVSFTYGNNKMVLENINLTINRGETIGIIGGTGSGKSTLINLIPHLYDVTLGTIEVNGTVKVVPQQASVVSGTIADNIRWGNESATDDDIWKALSIAQADKFVSEKSDGIHTMIDQGGKNVSGGQKQRLTIARAIVGNPDILILDDSLSALDAATDYMLRKAIKENCVDMTVIMVSQRAGSLRHSDKIVVMDNGKILDIGNHTELYDRCQVYREICESQSVSREV
jgi:ABC-type multidrug transport system, ATPase and permease components